MLSDLSRNPTVRFLCKLLILELISFAVVTLNEAKHPLPYKAGQIVLGLSNIGLGIIILALTFVVTKSILRKERVSRLKNRATTT
jgi:hypothetical protein